MGMDLRQEFNARNSGTTGAAKGSSSKSTETPSQRAARIAAGG
jgi:hypothetical protein